MNQYDRLKQLNIPAPEARQVPFEAQYHDKTLSDPYHWLKDQGYPEVDDQDVLDYLEAENAYYHAWLKPNQPLADKLFEEFKGRTDETETSVPYVDNGYEYQWFYRPGEDYRVRSRKHLETGKEGVFLDENVLAKDHDYFVLGDWDVSPDNTLLAYSVDTAGDERYEIHIKNLTTGEMLPDVLKDVQGDVLFSADGKSVVYALLEQEKWLAKNIKVHTLGTEQATDRTLFFEKDDGFFIGFDLTSSKDFLIISSSQGEVEEVWVTPADLGGELILMASRDEAFDYQIDHAHGYFYILANDQHKNFRLARVADNDPAYKNWETLQAGSDDVYLMNLQTFDTFMAISSREKGFEKIRVRDYEGKATDIAFPETVFAVRFSINPEFKQHHLRLGYESMITPDTVFDYHLDSGELLSRKVQKIPSGYDRGQYETERVMITARDGAQIPVSLVYKKGFKKDGSHPMHLYAYGAYGATITPGFSTLRLSILDRGFVFAIAHVRGGAMMGYHWYLDGKFEHRENTFNDFVDVARGLAKLNYTSEGNISASGRSAGGELMGAVTIQAPELWRSVNLGVPFVDVLNTMLDASLPLTPPEWEQWGNPIESARFYDIIAAYSPYDNIKAQAYPPMFVSGGLNDPRVTYWEPAKWTAKMRATKTDDNLLIMRINMGAGHFANSGRYGRLKDFAEEYAFMLLAHGISD